MNYSKIQFCHGSSQVDLLQLQELFQSTTFWAKNRRLEDLETAIANSEPVISVWDGDRLIGFARATSDGVYRAMLWDVVIHPSYQGRGLGRKLVETVLSHPRIRRVERVLLTTTNQREFYERMGFKAMTTSTTMMLCEPAAVRTASVAIETAP